MSPTCRAAIAAAFYGLPWAGSIIDAEVDMRFTVEIEQEADGRWIAEVPELPGTLVYGATRDEAVAKAKALALHVLADQLEHGETAADLNDISFVAA